MLDIAGEPRDIALRELLKAQHEEPIQFLERDYPILMKAVGVIIGKQVAGTVIEHQANLHTNRWILPASVQSRAPTFLSVSKWNKAMYPQLSSAQSE